FIRAHFSGDPSTPNDPFNGMAPGCNELQLTPWAPLKAGYYRLFLKGVGTLDSPNTDSTIHFRITGSEGSPSGSLRGDDASNTSHNLGDITNAGLVQIGGFIGDDPYYSFFDPSNSDPTS